MNMKKVFLRAVLLSLAAAAAAGAQDPTPFKPYAVSPRVIKIGNTPRITLCRDGKSNIEVVKPKDPAVEAAVGELVSRLHEITGTKPAVVARASGKVPAFYLGQCPEAEKLGLRPETLDRDGFFIKTDGNKIFITGCDGGKGTKLQRATLFGVFDFLERFAGVRYYFPGEIGTIVPKKKDWTLPAIDITERPDTQRRIIYCYPCARPPLDVLTRWSMSSTTFAMWKIGEPSDLWIAKSAMSSAFFAMCPFTMSSNSIVPSFGILNIVTTPVLPSRDVRSSR